MLRLISQLTQRERLEAVVFYPALVALGEGVAVADHKDGIYLIRSLGRPTTGSAWNYRLVNGPLDKETYGEAGRHTFKAFSDQQALEHAEKFIQKKGWRA